MDWGSLALVILMVGAVIAMVWVGVTDIAETVRMIREHRRNKP